MGNHLTPAEALKACRERAGSDSQMGRDLGIPQSTMWRIINVFGELPAEYVLMAEHLYGVSKHELRPDIYPLGDFPSAVVKRREPMRPRRRAHRLSGAAK